MRRFTPVMVAVGVEGTRRQWTTELTKVFLMLVGKPSKSQVPRMTPFLVMFNLDHSPLRAMRAIVREYTSRVNKMIVLR